MLDQKTDRILIDGRLLSNAPTGISRYSVELIQAFRKKYGPDKIFVIVNPESSRKEGFNYIETKLRPYNPVHYFFFSLFINQQPFSIYYSPFYSGIYYKKKNRKQIVTVHDLMYLRINHYFYNSSLKNRIAKYVFNALVKSTLKSADLVISVSRTTQEDLREFFNIESSVIGEGINYLNNQLKGWEKLTLRKKSDLEFILKNRYFLYVGNFRKQKNIPFLIEAFLKSNTDCNLVLAGKRNDQKEVSIHHEKIFFVDGLSDEEIHLLYKNCQAFIMPSLYEGFGLPVLEAYHAGARVFCSDQGALKEFDHLNIHYFSPYNQEELIALIKGANQLSKPTAVQIKAAKEKYNWEKQTGTILQHIDNL